MVADERDDSGRADGFDPRFDPAFQRGYQPQPGERARTRVRADAPDSAYRRPSSLLRTREDSVPATPSEPLTPYEEAALSLDEGRPALPEQLEPGTSAPQTVVVASAGALSGVELNPRRNPFLLALWLIGGGFVVLGIVLYAVSVTSSYSGPTPSTDVGALVFAQLGWMLAGPLITVGLLTLVALLFLTALSGRRMRDAIPEDDAPAG
ncbi:hypothetical protein ACF1AJ_14740 [Leifsonia sp. NPDC014704]|uniref:hypothetical protein n=1 Tax=Leifsonia sp. NPDC014704 TaxID=3364123 RepID=UPI0036F45FF9